MSSRQENPFESAFLTKNGGGYPDLRFKSEMGQQTGLGRFANFVLNTLVAEKGVPSRKPSDISVAFRGGIFRGEKFRMTANNDEVGLYAYDLNELFVRFKNSRDVSVACRGERFNKGEKFGPEGVKYMVPTFPALPKDKFHQLCLRPVSAEVIASIVYGNLTDRLQQTGNLRPDFQEVK